MKGKTPANYAGFHSDLIRLCIGIEHTNDVTADIDRVLAAASA